MAPGRIRQDGTDDSARAAGSRAPAHEALHAAGSPVRRSASSSARTDRQVRASARAPRGRAGSTRSPRTRRTRLPHEGADFRQVAQAQPSNTWSGNDDDVLAVRELVAPGPKVLPHEPSKPIADDGVSNLTRHRDPNSSADTLPGSHDHREAPPGSAHSQPPSAAVIRRGSDAIRPRERCTRGCSVPVQAHQIAMRFLPLARRRDRTFWPFLVRIRTRKPCVRLRRVLLG